MVKARGKTLQWHAGAIVNLQALSRDDAPDARDRRLCLPRRMLNGVAHGRRGRKAQLVEIAASERCLSHDGFGQRRQRRIQWQRRFIDLCGNTAGLQDMAEILEQSVRDINRRVRDPGKRTAEYLDYVLTRLTVIGAAYITVVCLLPELLIAKIMSPRPAYSSICLANTRW